MSGMEMELDDQNSSNESEDEATAPPRAGEPGAFVRITREQQQEIDKDYAEENDVEGSTPHSIINPVPQSMRLYRATLRRAVTGRTDEDIEKWSSDELLSRLDRVEELWKKFEDSWPMLSQQQLSDQHLAECSEFLAEAEEEYLQYKFKLREKLSRMRSNSQGEPRFVESFGGPPIHIQMSEPPRVPKFSGMETDWANFRAIFEAEVHTQVKFSDSQKMRHLLGALQGRAEQIYRNWPIGDGTTYRQLWSELCEHYGNEYNTIRVHLQTLSALRPLENPSCDAMREVLDTARNAFRQLQLLLKPEDVAGYMLLFQLELLLDADSRVQWSGRRSTKELPTLEEMFRFLELRASLLSQLPTAGSINDSQSNVQSGSIKATVSSNDRGRTTGRGNELPPDCELCSGQRHWPYHCPKFKNLSLADRSKYVMRQRRCINCFSSRHQSAKCPERSCPRCKVKHNSVLCPTNFNIGRPLETLHRLQRDAGAQQAVAERMPIVDSKRTQFMVNVGCSEFNTPVPDMINEETGKGDWTTLLATAIVRIKLDNCISPPLRALCDTGSQINFISDVAVRALKWSTQQCNIRVHGVGGMFSKPHTRKVTCQLLSSMDDTPIATVNLVIGSQLSDLWLPGMNIPEFPIPSEIASDLADPGARVRAPIDVLLGAGVWARVVRDGCFVNSLGIAFQPSNLGWFMYGGGVTEHSAMTAATGIAESTEQHLDQLLQRFWETEEIGKVRMRTSEQERCEEIFMQSYRRLPGGRFQVDIPLRNDVDQLGSSRAIALHRFRQLERRFERDQPLKEKYFAAIQDLMSAGHMQLADQPPKGWCYHIPHHPVLKKFRIVNDASCRTDMGLSLNDVQLVGEKLQDNLADLIMRFRCRPVAITADIKKMYLQVRINPAQWDLQRVFWRPTIDSPIMEYWLTVVTFGMASAPHCAVRAMIQGAREARLQYPMGADAVEHDFYMDDCLSGAETEEEARLLSEEIDAVLRSSGFLLDKWRSNKPNVVPFSKDTHSEDALSLSAFDDTTVLGLRWLPSTDELMFKFQPPPALEAREATKRKVLSRIAQIFDPNGYLGPVVVAAKIMMQKIWSANIGWDSMVPDSIYREWRRFEQQLMMLTKIRLPRWTGISRDRNISLHGFADASTLAYGAALYIRVEDNDRIECNLIAAKSRVAPLRTVTIPRLELCAALLLSELLQTFRTTAKLHHVKTTLWSDSQIVLAWLRKDASTLKIYVNNRVQKIHQLTSDVDWRYIPSTDNPADQLSRGTSAAELHDSRLWWHGPPWLLQAALHWPIYQLKTTAHMDLAIRQEERSMGDDTRPRQRYRELAAMIAIQRDVDLLTRASKLFELCRLTAWIFRFHHNALRKLGPRRSGPLSNTEINTAQEFWVREEQHVYYFKEIEALKESKAVDPSSPIANCTPWLDNKGLLRLGGRLGRAPIPMQQKYPLLLPDVSPLATLIIREAHEVSLHGGPNETMAFVRRKFWITNLRKAVRKQNWQCVTCARYRQQAVQQMMSELPADRVTPCRAFSHSGVDYAGPYLLKARGGRCNIIEKKYVAVFVCMVTKAVHLELVESLSTADFIQAFLRFTSIRGSCVRLWSDNGKNFEGAAVELRKMLRSWNEMDMAKLLQRYGTEWRFITPEAPHQGGIWEAAVKSMKHHLRRVIGPHKLTSSQFQTVLAQTSAVMNSRPLSALSDDPEDMSYLTPAHFLIGETILQPFGANVSYVPDNRLKLAKQIQKMSQVFWKAWSQDYLHQLQQRTKWRQPQSNLKVGDMVIICEDNIPPTFWKIARVIETFAGNDGLVRNVRLRVASSDWKIKPSEKGVPFTILERPVQKLCRLPVESEAEHSRGECVDACNAISTT